MSIMGEGWHTGRIGGGRINYWMGRNIGRKWWMGMECQKEKGMGSVKGVEYPKGGL